MSEVDGMPDAARLWSNLRLVFEGELQEGARAGQFELFADVGSMRLDGAVADEEIGADLFVGLVLRHETQDASLGGCESGESLLLLFQGGGALMPPHKMVCNRGANENAAGGHRLEANENIADGILLEDKALRA